MMHGVYNIKIMNCKFVQKVYFLIHIFLIIMFEVFGHQ
jgi:hypothetical protein